MRFDPKFAKRAFLAEHGIATERAAAKKSECSNDNVKHLKSYLHSEKITAKGLSKRFPDFANAIREGKIEPKDLPSVLQKESEATMLAELQKHLPDFDTKGSSVVRIGTLECMTGMEPLLCDLVRIACGTHDGFQCAFAKAFFDPEWPNIRDTIETALKEERQKMFEKPARSMKRTGPKPGSKEHNAMARVIEPLMSQAEEAVQSGNFDEAAMLMAKAKKVVNSGYNVDTDEIMSQSNETLMKSLENLAPIRAVHTAYDVTCKKFERDILSLSKKVPCDMEHCWAYNRTPRDFFNILFNLIERDKNFGLEDIVRETYEGKAAESGTNVAVEAAAKAILNGWDQIRRKCWECGKHDANILKCSGCQAARYCSIECQRKAWKSGHKWACSDLKCMYKCFTNNYCRIDRALDMKSKEFKHGQLEKGCELPPRGSKDYRLLPILLSNYTLPVVMSVDFVALGHVSVDNMYRNLVDVFKGKSHWMFDQTFQCDQWIKELVGKRDFTVTCNDDDYVLQAMLFLAYDVSIIPPAAVCLFRKQLLKTYMEENHNHLMPVNRFFEIYFGDLRQSHEVNDEGPISAARTEGRADCMTVMMKHFHKKKKDEMFPNIAALHKTVLKIRGLPVG